MRAALQLIVSVVICLAAGFLGSRVMSADTMAWYDSLRRPAFNPPDWLFAPVWTALYVLMGIALFLIWRSGGAGVDVRGAIAVFAAQLVLNALWTPAFFGLRSPGAGLAVILPLLALIIATIVIFWRIRPPAGMLLLPYAAWTAFAAVLNASIFALSR